MSHQPRNHWKEGYSQNKIPLEGTLSLGTFQVWHFRTDRPWHATTHGDACAVASFLASWFPVWDMNCHESMRCRGCHQWWIPRVYRILKDCWLAFLIFLKTTWSNLFGILRCGNQETQTQASWHHNISGSKSISTTMSQKIWPFNWSKLNRLSQYLRKVVYTAVFRILSIVRHLKTCDGMQAVAAWQWSESWIGPLGNLGERCDWVGNLCCTTRFSKNMHLLYSISQTEAWTYEINDERDVYIYIANM